MAENERNRRNRSLSPEVVGSSDAMTGCSGREVVGNISVVAGMLTALSGEVWHNVLPEAGQQATFFGGIAVAIGGLWRISRATQLRKYGEREPKLLGEVVNNLPQLAGNTKDSGTQLHELLTKLDQKKLAYEMAVKTGDTSTAALTTDEAMRHVALVRLASHCAGGAGLVNGAAAQIIHWTGCVLPPEMTAAGQRGSRRKDGQSEADSVHQTTLDILNQCVPLDGMTWREYVASPEFAVVCESARQINQGLRLRAKILKQQPANCFSHFSRCCPPEDNW